MPSSYRPMSRRTSTNPHEYYAPGVRDRAAIARETSVRMIERSYGALLDGAGAGFAGRLDALDAERGRATESFERS
jgi:hypothetical protein